MFNFAGTTDVVVDLLGAFDDGSLPLEHGQLVTLPPIRLLDTRGTAAVGPDQTIRLPVRDQLPADASVTAVVLNVTATDPTAAGYVTAWSDGDRPATSNVNMEAGRTRASLVATAPGADGAVRLYNFAGTTNLIADLQAWFR